MTPEAPTAGARVEAKGLRRLVARDGRAVLLASVATVAAGLGVFTAARLAGAIVTYQVCAACRLEVRCDSKLLAVRNLNRRASQVQADDRHVKLECGPQQYRHLIVFPRM